MLEYHPRSPPRKRHASGRQFGTTGSTCDPLTPRSRHTGRIRHRESGGARPDFFGLCLVTTHSGKSKRSDMLSAAKAKPREPARVSLNGNQVRAVEASGCENSPTSTRTHRPSCRGHRRPDHGRLAQTLITVSAAMESSTPPRSTPVIHRHMGLGMIAISPRIAIVKTAAVVLVNPCIL
jgi:hypothetical protein